MKKTNVILGLLLSLASHGWSAPMECVLDNHKEPVVPQGVNIVTKATCRNVTTRPIELIGTQTGCACLTARFTQPHLAPGATTKIVMTLETQGMTDKVSLPVEILAKDVATPIATLMVNADVRPSVIAMPEYVDLGDYRKGEGRTVLLVDTTGKSFTLKEISTDRGLVEIRWNTVEVVRMGDRWEVANGKGAVQGYQLRIQARPGKEMRRSLSDEVTLELAHPQQKRVRLRIVGYAP